MLDGGPADLYSRLMLSGSAVTTHSYRLGESEVPSTTRREVLLDGGSDKLITEVVGVVEG